MTSEKDYRRSVHKDFVVREHRLKIWHALAIFLSMFILIFTSSEGREYIGGTPAFVLLLILVIGGVGWFTIYFIQTHRDLVLATEFQNAIFANAAVLNFRFSAVVKRDGTLIYFDPGFQKTFPQFRHHEDRSLSGLMRVAGIGKSESDAILGHLDTESPAKIVVPLPFADGNRQIMWSIDPLPRPEGYFLIRGREFIDPRRSAESEGAGIAPEMLQHMLQYLPAAVAGVNAQGTIYYMSDFLRTTLGYQKEELPMGHVSINQVISMLGQAQGGQIVLMAFEGEATLLPRGRNTIITQVKIIPIFDAAGGLTGASILFPNLK